MKKILSIVFILIICFFSVTFSVKAAVQLPEKTDHEKVTMYLFYSKTCPHCHDFIEYFQKNYKSSYSDFFEIVAMEAGASSNGTLFHELANYFGDNEKGQIPYIIIGDYSTLGFADSKGPDLIEEALKQYQNENYKDVVMELKKETNIKTETLQEAAKTAGLEVIPFKDDTKNDALVIIIIFVILAVSLGGLVFASRRK